MQNNWTDFLQQHGANIEADLLVDFGRPQQELEALYQVPVITSLPGSGLLRVSGKDAENFLQSQLSNDVKYVSETSSQLSGYCTPKGRLLALFRMVKHHNDYLLILPESLLEATLKRLQMYVMRSDVTITDISNEFVQLGLVGEQLPTLLTAQFDDVPKSPDTSQTFRDGILVRLSGLQPRFLLLTEQAAASPIWEQLTKNCKPVGQAVWTLSCIDAGMPDIYPETIETFVPQMVNLQAINGLSFTKGCYPGQEIVARTKYLGKLKRCLYLGEIDSAEALAPATDIYDDSDNTQSIGKIVNAQIDKNGHTRLLAVLQISSADNHLLFVGDKKGPEISLKTLPYALDN